jgi:hypothetical protein
MVRITPYHFIIALASFGVAFGSPTKRDVAKVEADMAIIQSDIQTVTSDASAFESNCGQASVSSCSFGSHGMNHV